MKIVLCSVTPRRARPKSEPGESLVRDYLHRAARLNPVETAVFASEADLLASITRQPHRATAQLMLFHSRGEDLTSEGFAAHIGHLRDGGVQRLVCAIGPADGWSSAALEAANKTVSFGRITLPHELARVVAAEQIYRALTILAGHPYHSGH